MTRAAGGRSSTRAAPVAVRGRVPDRLTALVLDTARRAGIDAAGVATAERFDSTHRDLLERRAAGLHAGMQFTYRNPARSTDPGRALDGAASLVVGALSYLRAEEPSAAMVAPGRVARYAREDFYGALRSGLEAGAGVLRAEGHRAVVVADSNALVDREAAKRAGLGWYGRNANLLIPGQGSWFVLGTIVTDAVLVPDGEVEPGCGSCTRCISGCPTGAIVAPGVVDARRCLAWLVQAPGVIPWEFREVLGDRIYGCDDCQEVCPPNLVVQRRSNPGVGSEVTAAVDAVTFLDDDDAVVLAAAGRWYVQGRDARYLRRNALVVLGNVGDPDDPRVAQAVAAGMAHDDPLVRAHAVWAAARLGRPDLAEPLRSTEADAMVREELRRMPEVTPRVRR
ncbi:MAG: tRNA epoxyqueuosine(34) reductase QueG [Acidimicrobiales bacterium]